MSSCPSSSAVDEVSLCPATLPLGSGYAVVLSHGAERMEVRAPDGRVCLTLTLDAGGARVEIAAASVSVESQGDLTLGAERVLIAARQELVLSSGGALTLEAGGALATRAREQRIEATRGDVRIEANDDVRVDGERVLLNTPGMLPLRRLDEERAELQADLAAPSGCRAIAAGAAAEDETAS